MTKAMKIATKLQNRLSLNVFFIQISHVIPIRAVSQRVGCGLIPERKEIVNVFSLTMMPFVVTKLLVPITFPSCDARSAAS